MGSSFSPIVANILMESFQTKSINSYHLKAKVWKRFVDDTNVIWPHGRDELSKFVHHLNNQYEHIPLSSTMDMEENGSIPFLDVRVTKILDGTLSN
jgi:hypothetical protein